MRFLDDLVDPAFTLDIRQANAINNAGQIATFSKAPYNSTDQLVLLSPVSTAIEGDLDADGFVGITDLNIVLSNWNQSVPPGDPSAGDPSADGFVGIEDLNTVLGNWNVGTPPPPGVPPEVLSTAPEPGTLVLLGAGGLMWVRRRQA
jgi:PEP-CTERM motif